MGASTRGQKEGLWPKIASMAMSTKTSVRSWSPPVSFRMSWHSPTGPSFGQYNRRDGGQRSHGRKPHPHLRPVEPGKHVHLVRRPGYPEGDEHQGIKRTEIYLTDEGNPYGGDPRAHHQGQGGDYGKQRLHPLPYPDRIVDDPGSVLDLFPEGGVPLLSPSLSLGERWRSRRVQVLFLLVRIAILLSFPRSRIYPFGALHRVGG